MDGHFSVLVGELKSAFFAVIHSAKKFWYSPRASRRHCASWHERQGQVPLVALITLN